MVVVVVFWATLKATGWEVLAPKLGIARVGRRPASVCRWLR